MYKGKIPFDDKGNQLHYPEFHSRLGGEWKDNFKFNQTMKIVTIERGRSAAYFILEDEHEVRYTMFCTDIVGLLKGISFTGEWEFVKRGRNFGIKKSSE